jgi:hypothetical protein
VMPVVFLLAAAAWLAWREAGLRLTRARRALAAVLALLMLACVLPSLRVHAHHPAFGLSPDEAATPPPEAPDSH